MHGLESLSVKRKPECFQHLSSNVSSMQEYVFRLKTDIGLDLFHPHDNLEGNFQTNTIIYTILFFSKAERSDPPDHYCNGKSGSMRISGS